MDNARQPLARLDPRILGVARVGRNGRGADNVGDRHRGDEVACNLGRATFVPIGGIAYSGARGISKVEVQVDDRPWQPAALRQPLSELTWVIWRYDWPLSAGRHYLAVRCYDGEGVLQETEKHEATPRGATGLFKEYRDF